MDGEVHLHISSYRISNWTRKLLAISISHLQAWWRPIFLPMGHVFIHHGHSFHGDGASPWTEILKRRYFCVQRHRQEIDGHRSNISLLFIHFQLVLQCDCGMDSGLRDCFIQRPSSVVYFNSSRRFQLRHRDYVKSRIILQN